MRKFLLTLIVTMLTCIGAWAQDEETILQNGQTELSADDVIALNLEEDHILKLYYRNDNQNWGYLALRYKTDQWGNTAELFNYDNKIYWKDSYGEDDWGVVSYTLTEADVANLNAGIKIDVNQVQFGKLTLTKPVYEGATGVTISKETLTLEFNGNETLTASVNPEGARQKVIWSAIDGTGKVTVDQDGKVTGVAAGTATVRATAKSNPEIYADCEVIVNAPIKITDFTLAPTSVELLKGDKTTLTVSILPDNAADKSVTWESNNTSVATIYNGEVTAEGRGTATITAKSASIDGADPFTATATVTVKENLAPTSSDLKTSYIVGDEYTPTIALSNPNFGEIAYSSDNTEVIKIEDGKIIALKDGNANITVTITPSDAAIADNFTNTPWTNTFAVTVVKPAFGLTIVANPSAIQVGESGTVNVIPTVTLNGAATENNDYEINYTLEGAAGIDIDEATGEVTVPKTAEVQEFYIVATLTPNTDLYTGATAKAKVLVADLGAIVTISVDDAGVYTINVPFGDAFGPNLLDDPTSGDNAPAQLINGATLAGLKAASTVKVTGLLKNSDVQEIVNLIGESEASKMGDQKIKSLDMGGAKMTEAITTVGSKCSLVPSNGKALMSLESLTLPQPAVGVAGATVLPRGMGYLTSNQYTWSVNSLTTLVIPEGWTEVGDEAWAISGGQAYTGGGSNVNNLTSIQFPKTLIKIGNYAFSNSSLEKIFFPPYIEYIGEGAFNTALKLSDVYFTGDKNSVPAIKYVDPNAFSVQTQMVNNCIENDDICNNKNMPTMDRSHYVNGGTLACILHFPEGLDQYYTDVTRKYKVMDTSKESGITYKKNTEGSIYTPENWTAEWVQQMSTLSKNQNMMVGDGGTTVSGGFPDNVYGYSLIWPSQYQMTCGYTIANAGYLWSGEKMSSEQYDPDNGVDLRGLYQFIVAMGNAPEDPKEWTFHYELDKWYTIALPFNMTPAQIKDVFGPTTQVCRFSKVTRIAEGDEKKIVLEFRKSVMLDGDGRAEDNTYSVLQYDSNDNPVGYLDIEHTEGGIQHHWPYMIKPGGKAEGQFEMKFKNYDAIPGILNQDKVNSESNVSTDQPQLYAFSPMLTKQYYVGDDDDDDNFVKGGGYKKNSYIFVNNINGTPVDHQYVFFKGIKDGNEYRDGGVVTAFTAYVQLNHGQDEYDTFFAPEDTNGQSLAPIYASLFGGDEAVNGIEKVVIVCGTDSIDNDKIYTINGVLVNGTHLPAGLYIKNGKKFIVK